MKILIVPMSAMAETAGPISRCRLKRKDERKCAKPWTKTQGMWWCRKIVKEML